MRNLHKILELATSGGVPQRALVVSMLIGTTLNLINQGDALLRGGTVSWTKIVLTYIVPYLVSTHGAVAARLRTARAMPDHDVA